jgi:hypothetical protein
MAVHLSGLPGNSSWRLKMLKSLVFFAAIATAAGGLAVPSALAIQFSDVPEHTTAALCRQIYDVARNEPNSVRDAKDAYITCIGRL